MIVIMGMQTLTPTEQRRSPSPIRDPAAQQRAKSICKSGANLPACLLPACLLAVPVERDRKVREMARMRESERDARWLCLDIMC